VQATFDDDLMIVMVF